MTVTIAKWDTAEVLTTRKRVIAYLNAVLEDGDPEMLKLALGNVARSAGMTELAHETGIRRTSLYKALSAEGNPEFATIARVIKALGLRLSVVPGPATVRTALHPAKRAEIRASDTTAKPRPKTAPPKKRAAKAVTRKSAGSRRTS